MKLIDKDALAAEIEKWQDEIKKNIFSILLTGSDRSYAAFGYRILGLVRDFIDTLEVKEVDLCKEEERIWKDFNMGECHLSKNDLENIAKHFFELGVNASK